MGDFVAEMVPMAKDRDLYELLQSIDVLIDTEETKLKTLVNLKRCVVDEMNKRNPCLRPVRTGSQLYQSDMRATHPYD